MTPLWDALGAIYDQLGFDTATDHDQVFRQLALARITEPTSKADSLRVLATAGIATVSYATVKRRLHSYADDAWQQRLVAACAAHARLGPADLVLYDVSFSGAPTGAQPRLLRRRRSPPVPRPPQRAPRTHPCRSG